MFLVSLSVAKTAANVSTQARLAQSVEHETLNLRVVGSSPTLGEIFFQLHQHHWGKNFTAATRDRTGDL